MSLPEIAEMLARSLGHDPKPRPGFPHGCPKIACSHNCSCGAGAAQAKALDEYERWKRGAGIQPTLNAALAHPPVTQDQPAEEK